MGILSTFFQKARLLDILFSKKKSPIEFTFQKLLKKNVVFEKSATYNDHQQRINGAYMTHMLCDKSER